MLQTVSKDLSVAMDGVGVGVVAMVKVVAAAVEADVNIKTCVKCWFSQRIANNIANYVPLGGAA